MSKRILLSSKSQEWYTPSIYVEAARLVMGGIDLDPASSEEANAIVRAVHFYTEQENGLVKQWHGRFGRVTKAIDNPKIVSVNLELWTA